MGWSGGTLVCERAWQNIRDYVGHKHRTEALSQLIIALQEQDWDCEDEIEASWPEAKEALLLSKKYWRERRAKRRE